jgi:hypothetical protein
MNKNTIKIALIAVLGLSLTGVGVGGAVAATTPPTNPSVGSSSTSSPTTKVVETPGTEIADGAESTAPETPGTEQPGAASDGNDGGHADANGVDVNHQGGANEK